MDPASLARSLKSALVNPYSRSYPHPPEHNLNCHGYTYSSTYNPSSYPPISNPSFSNLPSPSAGRSLPPRSAPPTHWYSPGNSKCTYSGCTFTGSVNSVQTHMMDRHLIYPPGWHSRKRQPDWDADPSLKRYVLVHTQPGRGYSNCCSCASWFHHSKPVPILGTNVRLDTPEEIAAWIAERKRRWPTDVRVSEKKRKLEQAMANGELHPDHLALMGGKRFRPQSSDPDVTRNGRGRGGGPFGFGGSRGRGRGRGRGAYGRDRVPERSDARDGITSSASTLPSSRSPVVRDTGLPQRPSVPSAPSESGGADAASHLVSDDNDEDEDEDAAPEVMSTKRPPDIVSYGSSSDAEQEKPDAVNDQPELTITSSSRSGPDAVSASQQSSLPKAAESANRPRKAPPPQPKKPPRNPFAARPSLLRNVSASIVVTLLSVFPPLIVC
jgi:hypothetical protein